MTEWWRQPEHRWGLLLGAMALLADFLLMGRLGARPLADPLPLFLTLGQLTRGFTRGLIYWNYQPALIHLAFLTAVVLAAFGLLAWRKLRTAVGMDLTRAAMVAVAVPLVARSLLRIDHLVVGFYYLLSLALSFGWTLFLSRQLNRILRKIGYDGASW